MSEIKISESSIRYNNVNYLYQTLGDIITQIDAKVDVKNGRNRYELSVDVPEGFKELFVAEAEDKIADVIAINYKYNYFKRNICPSGLSQNERELLYMALISADLDEDKKYIVRKLRAFSEYSIDGIFNFRMKPLKEKWGEIISYIPPTFASTALKDFISYLIKDKRGKKIYFENGKVYDKHYNLLKRIELVGTSEELSAVKEIILSGAGEIELISPLPDKDEYYVKEFFGERVSFASDYYS